MATGPPFGRAPFRCPGCALSTSRTRRAGVLGARCRTGEGPAQRSGGLALDGLADGDSLAGTQGDGLGAVHQPGRPGRRDRRARSRGRRRRRHGCGRRAGRRRRARRGRPRVPRPPSGRDRGRSSTSRAAARATSPSTDPKGRRASSSPCTTAATTTAGASVGASSRRDSPSSRADTSSGCGASPSSSGSSDGIGGQRARPAQVLVRQTQVRGGQHVQPGQRLPRRGAPGGQHGAEVGVHPDGVGHHLAVPLVLGLHRHLLAVHQLAAQPLELHAGALELGAGPGSAQRRLGGDLGRPAAQDPVPQQGVHRGAGLGDGSGRRRAGRAARRRGRSRGQTLARHAVRRRRRAHDRGLAVRAVRRAAPVRPAAPSSRRTPT